MGGPSASILLPATAILELDELLDNTITKIAAAREGEDFWVTDTRPIGGNYRGEGRPFVLSSQRFQADEFEGFDPPLTTLLQSAFALVPAHQVGVDAMCNNLCDHHILGELVLHISSMTNGIIDFGGEALPPEVVDDSVAVGTYFAASGAICQAQFVRPTFLRAWLGHPDFKMVK